jgi:hypothetical protein
MPRNFWLSTGNCKNEEKKLTGENCKIIKLRKKKECTEQQQRVFSVQCAAFGNSHYFFVGNLSMPFLLLQFKFMALSCKNSNGF